LTFFDELGRFGAPVGQRVALDRRGFGISQDRLALFAKELVTSGIDAVLAAVDAAQPVVATILRISRRYGGLDWCAN
jgi:hypothetical protein